MKKLKRILSLLLCAAMVPLSACSGGEESSSASQPEASVSSQAEQESDTITITDHGDNQVTLPRQIDRIVVTDIYPLPSVITVFLGSADKLVGIHPTSMSAAQSGLLGEIFPEILEADTSKNEICLHLNSMIQ